MAAVHGELQLGLAAAHRIHFFFYHGEHSVHVAVKALGRIVHDVKLVGVVSVDLGEDGIYG